MKKLFIFLLLPLVIFNSCKKKETETETTNTDILGQAIEIPTGTYLYPDLTLNFNSCEQFEDKEIENARIINQCRRALKISYSIDEEYYSSWISLDEIELPNDFFLLCVDSCLGCNSDALEIIKCNYNFSKQEIIDNLKIISKDSIFKYNQEKNIYAGQMYIEAVLSSLLFRNIEFNNYETNPMHVLATFANEEMLKFYNESEYSSDFLNCYDEEGRNCLMIAIQANNLEAVKFFSSNKNYSYFHETDNDNNSVSDYLENYAGNSIKNYLYGNINYSVLKEKCEAYLALNITSFSPDSNFMIQNEFEVFDTAYVLNNRTLYLPDGTTYPVAPLDEVKILYLLKNEYGELFYDYDEYENDSTVYPYYLVQHGNFDVGIISGINLVHSKVFDEGKQIYASYKNIKIKNQYKHGYSVYADLYSYDESSKTFTNLNCKKTSSYGSEKAAVFIGNAFENSYKSLYLSLDKYCYFSDTNFGYNNSLFCIFWSKSENSENKNIYNVYNCIVINNDNAYIALNKEAPLDFNKNENFWRRTEINFIETELSGYPYIRLRTYGKSNNLYNHVRTFILDAENIFYEDCNDYTEEDIPETPYY